MDSKKILEKVEEYKQFLLDLRHDLHRHPELSMEEYRTSEKVREALDEHGIPYRRIGETGIIADIKGGKEGPCILLRGDMDALPVTEETDLPYKSEIPGKMHACGHDTHTSMLLTAGLIINDLKEELSGTVRLMFQPSEETAAGAKLMLEGGALEGVDACFAQHVLAAYPYGEICCIKGPTASAAGLFKIDIVGKSGHGSAPHSGIDAICAAASYINNVQMLMTREISPMQPAVITFGTIHGGDRFNIIPEHVTIDGTIRTYDQQATDTARDILFRAGKGTEEAFRCKVEVDHQIITTPTVNDAGMIDLAENAVKKLFGEGHVTAGDPPTGSEDFCWFSEQRPTAYVWLGCGDPDAKEIFDNHHSRFRVDERVLPDGTALLVQVAFDYCAQ